MDEMFDVLIIGYGPAGATAANLLGKRGYRVALIDQSLTIYDKPRAITADQEVMRVFQECGLAEDINATTTAHPGTDFIGVDGDVIKRFYPQPPPDQLAWMPAWMFVQPELEATLRRGVARYACVREYLGHKFAGLSQTEDHAVVSVRRLHDGVLLDMKARYVIACDGGRSAVRKHFNVGIDDLAFDEWWIVIDAWLRRDAQLPPRCVQYCRPSRPGTYIVGPGTLRRWEIKLLPGETPEDFQDEAVMRKVLGEFVDVDALELCRTATYRFHALVVSQWRYGRVFLMGDAAHQMPPFLGQGLCAAIRDAINLVWKLDAVERMKAAPALLDTYGAERTPHVRTIVSHAKAFGLIIGELDEQAARQRDARLLSDLAAGKAETVRQKFIPGLEAGLIDLDAEGLPRAGAGALFVQPWVRVGGESACRLDDLLRPGFLLVSQRAEIASWLDDETRALWRRLEGQDVVIARSAPDSEQGSATLAVTERDSIFSDWIGAMNASAVLVRPDRYVYGSAKTPEQLQGLVRSLHAAVFDGR